MGHDQNFKNLILDYPREALAFFAPTEAADIPSTARFLPLRQEQLQERLGERFRELDTPLLVEWSDRQREAVLFVVEEESDVRRFSIVRLAHYCLDLADLLDVERIVPVVIFLRAGRYPLHLRLGTERMTYLEFRYIACDLARLPVEPYLGSRNIVARLNLPNLRHTPEQRLEVFLRAQEGLAELESDPEKQLKYSAFIDQYANLTEAELAEYQERYLPRSAYREKVMGFTQHFIDKGIQQGIQQGVQQQILEGIELGLELKFGQSGLAMLPEIRQLHDLAVLRAIHEGLKRVGSLDELRQLYTSPQ